MTTLSGFAQGAAALWERLPVPPAHLVGIGAGVLTQRPLGRRLPRSGQPVGIAMLAAGVAVNAWALRARGPGSIERPHRLVTTGPHRFTRNPMYVGWHLLHLGTALTLRSPAVAATWPPTAVLMHRSVRTEERLLAGLFGEEFATYAGQVPRYLGLTSRSGERRQPVPAHRRE